MLPVCFQDEVCFKVERIGDARKPGPGRFRSHRRGQRSIEAASIRRARFCYDTEQIASCHSKDDHAAQDAWDGVDALPIQPQCLNVWHINIQGLRSHVAELVARLRMSEQPPQVICLNETFLDQSVGEVELEGYVNIARWDRAAERGGVCIYARQDIAQQVTLLSKSGTAERLWCVLHTDCGPYLLGAWYRPPSIEVASMETCEKEHEQLSEGLMGTLLVGDVNVHHLQWLVHSRETTAGGKRMRLAAAQMGLKQVVDQPTRGNHLLDLVLTDVPGTTARVLPKIADHCVVEAAMPLPVPRQELVLREGWKFGTADWDRLNADLEEEDWTSIEAMSTDDAANHLSKRVLELAEKSIQKTIIRDRKSTHPWLNDTVLQAVANKREAEGTPEEAARAETCSEVVKREYFAWVASVRRDLQDKNRGSKTWWARERQLQLKTQKCCSIPALKKPDGSWVRNAQGKADLLAQTLAGTYKL